MKTFVRLTTLGLLGLGAGATLTASTPTTRGPVLFSNLDPAGSVSPEGLGAVGPAQIAFPFTTPSYSASLKKLVISLRRGIGSSNEQDVTLVNDSSGQPGTTVMETIHLSGVLSSTAALISIRSALNPLLAANTTYWVIVGATDGNGVTWTNGGGTVLPVARSNSGSPWVASGSNSLGLDVVAMSNTNVGIFRSGFFWLEDVDGNQMFNTPPDRAFAFGGVMGDIPISGDWNGLGTTKVGVYRPSNGLFVLDYDGDGQFTSADKAYNLGLGIQPGDIPVVGDWNGDGRDKVGIFRAGFLWILDTNGDGMFEQGTDQTIAFGGVNGDVPVVGDWNGTGTSKIGLFRDGFFWILDANGDGVLDNVNQPGGDQAFAYGGIQGDVPVIGDWNGSGISKVGVFRSGFFWVLDANGNQQFDGTGAGQDLAFAFGGIPGDICVVGKW